MAGPGIEPRISGSEALWERAAIMFVRNGSYHLKLLAKYCDDTKVLRFETLSSMLRKEPDLRPPLQA